jgi:hypothetical protein
MGIRLVLRNPAGQADRKSVAVPPAEVFDRIVLPWSALPGDPPAKPRTQHDQQQDQYLHGGGSHSGDDDPHRSPTQRPAFNVGRQPLWAIFGLATAKMGPPELFRPECELVHIRP